MTFYCLLMCLKNVEIVDERIMIMSKALFGHTRFKVGCNA